MAKVRKRKRKIANASQMARLLGVGTSTVIGWVERGCPVVSQERLRRKTRWVFDVAAVKKWRKRDLAQRQKPRPDIGDPLSLANGLMSKDEEARFRRILERLIRPTDE